RRLRTPAENPFRAKIKSIGRFKLATSSTIASVLDDRGISSDASGCGSANSDFKSDYNKSSKVQRRPSALLEMSIMRRHLVASGGQAGSLTSLVSGPPFSSHCDVTSSVGNSQKRAAWCDSKSGPQFLIGISCDIEACQRPLPVLLISAQSDMANVLQPVIRKPKRSNWFWYTIGAFWIAVIGGLCYLVFSVELDPVVFELTAVKEMPVGATQNDRLSEIEQIRIDPHSGAESIVYVNGTLYTGTVDGKILRIRNSKVEVFHDLNPSNCDSMAACGRPLGMRLSKDKKSLVFADAFHGIFSLALTNGSIVKLFPNGGNFTPVFFNDLDILPNGNIFLSESSVKYSLYQIFADLMESKPNGRQKIDEVEAICNSRYLYELRTIAFSLLLVNPRNSQYRVFVDNLHFPNGVQLHRDGKSVLVVETTRARVIRVPLDEKSSTTVFVDGLPGYPDNIRLSPRGGYWIPVGNIRGDTLFSKMVEWSSRWPAVRRAAFRVSQ
ncbi:Strictosidine synthase, partial [Fasciolopsis buskii]